MDQLDCNQGGSVHDDNSPTTVRFPHNEIQDNNFRMIEDHENISLYISKNEGNPDAKSEKLLSNKSGTSYKNAIFPLVKGDIHQYNSGNSNIESSFTRQEINEKVRNCISFSKN